MTGRNVGKNLALTVILYLFFPLVAGLFAIGDRDGPKIYLSSYHTVLYMITYEWARSEKPRENPFYDRPWFYGFPESNGRLRMNCLRSLSRN